MSSALRPPSPTAAADAVFVKVSPRIANPKVFVVREQYVKFIFGFEFGWLVWMRQ
jgi:hypothetical protein